MPKTTTTNNTTPTYNPFAIFDDEPSGPGFGATPPIYKEEKSDLSQDNPFDSLDERKINERNIIKQGAKDRVETPQPSAQPSTPTTPTTPRTGTGTVRPRYRWDEGPVVEETKSEQASSSRSYLNPRPSMFTRDTEKKASKNKHRAENNLKKSQQELDHAIETLEKEKEKKQEKEQEKKKKIKKNKI